MTRDLSQGEAMPRCSAMTAKEILKNASLFTWLLPWNIKTYLYLRNALKECNTFLRAIGRLQE